MEQLVERELSGHHAMGELSHFFSALLTKARGTPTLIESHGRESIST